MLEHIPLKKKKWDEEFMEAMIDTKGMWLVERIEAGNKNTP